MYKEIFIFFFFFQAEDGIRDYKVTGVRRVLFRSKAVPRTSTSSPATSSTYPSGSSDVAGAGAFLGDRSPRSRGDIGHRRRTSDDAGGAVAGGARAGGAVRAVDGGLTLRRAADVAGADCRRL